MPRPSGKAKPLYYPLYLVFFFRTFTRGQKDSQIVDPLGGTEISLH